MFFKSALAGALLVIITIYLVQFLPEIIAVGSDMNYHHTVTSCDFDWVKNNYEFTFPQLSDDKTRAVTKSGGIIDMRVHPEKSQSFALKTSDE